MFIPFNIMASWGANNNIFVIYIDRGCADTEKIYFETFQTRMIQILVQSYCNIIAGISINEMSDNNVNTGRRIESSVTESGEITRSKTASSYKKY